MKRPLNLRITDEHTQWESLKFVGDSPNEVAVKVECRSYTCPLCRKKKFTILMDGKHIHGGSASMGTGGGWVDYCGAPECSRRASRLCKGWRRFIQERMEDGRHWMAWRCQRFAAWLRREKWYVADSYHGVPGNRASELRQQIWTELVSTMGPGKLVELDGIEPKLSELAQMAGEAWGHLWPEKKTKT